MRRDLPLWALSVVGTFPAVRMYAQQDSRPNVIYVMADDLGIGDLGCYGQKKIKTPTIDSLAATGIRFTQHYSGCTVSAPSRCSLLTGKHTGHTYIRGNNAVKVDGENYDQPLPASEITVADLFKQADYATACTGKWGLGGPNTVGDPGKHGFDYFYGYLGQGQAHRYYPQYLHETSGGTTRKIDLQGQVYSHDLIVEKTLDFIEKNAGRPFFLYFSPTIPHADLSIPELGEYEHAFEEGDGFKGNGSYLAQPKPKAAYAAMVTRLDYDVKRIIDLLREKGILENTLIIFTSDNGVHREGGHDPDFFNSNGIYRGIKRDMYEGGIRAPFVVNWPARIKNAQVTDHISAFWDFLPTMCELIGVEAPEGIDGISYLPTITGEGKQGQHDYLYWEFHENGGRRAVRRGDWKLIELNVNKYSTKEYELYNIQKHPGEKASYNEASGNSSKMDELLPLLKGARTENEIWNFGEADEIEGSDILKVEGGSASSQQDGEKFHKSYDQDFGSIYHCQYSYSLESEPVTLTYDLAPSDIRTIVYYTRRDGNKNGNFKKFELWAQPNGSSEYIRIGDYDFRGETGKHRIDFTDENEAKMKNVRSVRFVVKSGVSNLVSCCEMIFYGKKVEFALFDIPDLEKVVITDARASSEEKDKEIQHSYDGKFSPNYHSRFSNHANQEEGYFPVVLDYFFEDAKIHTFVYYTRTSETNGNFREFELWGLPSGVPAEDGNRYSDDRYIHLGTYNFYGHSGMHRVDFTDEQTEETGKLKGLKFKVFSGVNDLVSCSEMVFYKPANFMGTTESFSAEGNPVFAVRDGRIFLTGNPGADFEVYSASGIRYDRNSRLSPGIYIVKKEEKAVKVRVD